MAPGVIPDNLKQIERETDVLISNKFCEKWVVHDMFPWKRIKKRDFSPYSKNDHTEEQVRVRGWHQQSFLKIWEKSNEKPIKVKQVLGKNLNALYWPWLMDLVNP